MAGTVNAGSVIYEVDMDTAKLLAARREVDAALNGMGGNMGRLEANINRTERATDSASRSMSKLGAVASGLLAALSVQQVGAYADAWTELNNKVANSVKQGEQQADVMQRIFDISQATQSSLNGTATLYARLERGTRLYNTSAADLVKLTTIINQGFAVSGATAQEAENAIIQLSQGLAAGALRGEEYNSVAEQGSRLTNALADSLGVSIGQLRAMAAEGKLTTEVVVNGLLSQGDAIGKEFANTTVTISKGLLVAGNNITKFFGENSTVKAFAAIFRDSVVGLSENIAVLSGLLVSAAAFMGSRYVGALTLAAASKVKLALATREQAAAEQLAAAATARMTASNLSEATAAKNRAVTELQLAFNLKQAAVGAEQVAIAEARLTAARVAATAAVNNYNRANAANIAAQARIASGASIASRALSLVGGPVGAAMLAASAIFYFKQRSDEARQSAIGLAESVNELTAKFKSMTAVQIAASIAKLREQIPELTDAQKEAQDAFDTTTARVANLRKEIDRYGENTTRGKQAAAVLQDAMDAQSIAADNLTEAQNRLSRIYSAVSRGQSELTTGVKQGIDLLKRDQEEVGISTGMLNHFADALDFAAKAKMRFNSTNLVVERPKKLQEYLDKLQERVEVESILNDRLREQQEAENDARALGGGDREVAMARERAGAIHDSRKAQQEANKEKKKGEAEDKKAANQQETVAQKLANLKQQSELAAGSTQELSREQAILRAEQSLGKGATESQIQQARSYAAANWDAVAAIKARNAIPELKENADYTAQKAQLEMLKEATDANGNLLISQQQYNAASEQLEQDHQDKLAQIRAGQVVTPQQQSAGLVDPVQALSNEHAKKLALIQQFETQKGQITQRGLELMNVANTQYEQQRIAAQWEIWRNQSAGNEALAASFDALAGNASNALTGMITGSMSASEAMRSLGSTVLNSLVNTFVQMGVEWVKSAVMGAAAQQAGIAATTAASVAGTATSTAASTAAAATTTAAWTPAAIVASIGSFGGAAASGIGAVLGALAMGVAGKRKNGGPVSAGSMYQVGEGGMPEIYQASNGSQYMIPGDNGKVLSNKDITGGGGITIINQIENYSSGAMVDTQASSDGNGNVTIQTIVTDIANGGQIGQAISNYHNAPRRARG